MHASLIRMRSEVQVFLGPPAQRVHKNPFPARSTWFTFTPPLFHQPSERGIRAKEREFAAALSFESPLHRAGGTPLRVTGFGGVFEAVLTPWAGQNPS